MVADLTSETVGAADAGALEGISTKILARARRVTIKIGSALLVDPESGLRAEWLAGFAADVAALRAEGRDVIVVSSGAIALGRRELGLGPGPLSLERAQAAAAVGQIALGRAYAEALERLGARAGQVLLTLGDTQDRRRFLNGCATLKTLLDLGVAPIVNENDTVATDEIRYGDNDRLAARVALMAGAEALILLSDVDGLYTANPRKDRAARRLELVEEITPEIEAMGDPEGGPGAKGGMATKLLAAKTATQGGCAVAIARGAPERGAAGRAISALRAGAPATWFTAAESPHAARKQWIAGMKPMGVVTIDAGAVQALAQGKSLLPAGVVAVEGGFQRGDPIEIRSERGARLGAALAGYSAEEAARIKGRRSAEIADILGYAGRAAMAHRDDLAFFG